MAMNAIDFYNYLTILHGDGMKLNIELKFFLFLLIYRTHSDSSLHHTMMPSVAAHYHTRNENDNNGIHKNDLNLFLKEFYFPRSSIKL
jgi:hypothetical protein